MKQFPRIYSLSTVGIIFHLHNDYLLHPLRTDFTGESGIGKSLIADFLQLIFIGKKGGKYYRPGTESSGDIGRNAENLALQNFGYIFLTVQKSKDEFLTIGVYIQKSTKSVTPFIIQKGIEWEREKLFTYNDKILLSKDFLDKRGVIHDIKLLRKSVLKPREYILEMFNGRKLALYHHLLFYNKILPIDLSQQEDKLLSYAQIIQSFSRAKSLKMDKLALKNFLFADDNSIHEEYSEHIRKLEEYQRNYIKSGDMLKRTEERFSALKDFKTAYNIYRKKKVDFIREKTCYWCNKLNEVKARAIELEEKIVVKSISAVQFKLHEIRNKLTTAEILIKNKTTELKKAKNDITNLPTEINSQSKLLTTTNEQLETTQGQVFELRKKTELIKLGDDLIEEFKSLENAKIKVEEQQYKIKLIQNISDFDAELNQKGLMGFFEDSIFMTSPYDKAMSYAIERREELNSEMIQHEKLQNLFRVESPNSLFNWFRNRNISLSLEEESVFIYFCELSTTPKKNPSARDRYIENPDLLFTNLQYKRETEGLWLLLSGISEYIPFVKQRLFDSLDKVRSGLSSLKNQYKDRLQVIQKEYNQLDKLIKSILSNSANAEAIHAYQNKSLLKDWIKNETLEKVKDIEALVLVIKQKDKTLKSYMTQCEKEKQLQQTFYNLNTDLSNKQAQLRITNNKITELENSLETAKSQQKQLNTLLKARQSELIAIKSKYHSIEYSILETTIAKCYKQIAETTDKDVAIEKINKEIGRYTQELEELKEKDNILSIHYHSKQYNEAVEEFHEEMGRAFDLKIDLTSLKINESELKEMKEEVEEKLNEVKLIRNFKIVELAPDNNRLKESLDYLVLSQELLPQVFSDINPKDWDDVEGRVTQNLISIRESMAEINEHKLRLISNIFGKVESAFNTYELKAREMKTFFKKHETSAGTKVMFEFKASEHYPITWIHSLKRSIRNQANFFTPLFEGSSHKELSAEKIIIDTFKHHSKSKILPEIKRLTDPKSYFDVEANLVRNDGEKTDGSSGQDYAKIALLCIARLTKIEEDPKKGNKIREGLRFMAIDEVAGLGSNFDLLYQIAKEYDYQIITMTVEPSLSIDQGMQFSYILNMGKQTKKEKINPPPFGMFSMDKLERNVKAFIEAQSEA